MTVPYTKGIAAAVYCLGEDGTDRASGRRWRRSVTCARTISPGADY